MKKLIGLGIIGLIIVCLIGLYGFNKLYKSPAHFKGNQKIIKVPTNSSYPDILEILVRDSIIKKKTDMALAAKLMKYDDRDSYPSGKYLFNKNATVKDIIGILRAGRQVPVDLVINNVRSLRDLCGKMSIQIEPDSNTLYQYFTNPSNLETWGYNEQNILSLFIPNTYEVFWNIGLDNLYKRLNKEHYAFWGKNDRESKLQYLNLDKKQVYTLASIVEKESNFEPERPTIAGVYLNRLKNGIPLQADPTVVFATGNFDLRRVLNKHLETDSPYNTYKYQGLPPGPIYMPSLSSIDAVLNAEEHNYLYFCAKPGYGAEHAFAKNLVDHNANAKRFHDWLRTQKIK